MFPTLLPNDFVFVSKYSYNLKTPYHIPFTNISIPSFSIPGLKSVQRNDIIVFKKPSLSLDNSMMDESDFLVKRCIGIPGDTIRLNNLGLDFGIIGYSDFSEAFSSIKDYQIDIPIIIPKKNDTIFFTDTVSHIFRNIILGERNTLEYYNNSVYINGKKTSKYVVKNNYYFVLGDNYLFSLDSRRFGFVADDLIIGQVLLVVFSFEKKPSAWYDKIRWRRIGKIP